MPTNLLSFIRVGTHVAVLTGMATSADPEKHFLSLAKTFDNAMLVSRSMEHGLHARPMAVAQIEDDGELWFVTSLDSPKVDEMKADDQVLVVMQNSNQYLSLAGRAEIVRNTAKVKELWSEAWRIWFSGPDDPKLVLIRIHGQSAEYWDNAGVRGLRFLFRAASAYVKGEKVQDDVADPKQHAKVPL